MTQPLQQKYIWIIGASAGIGAELATQLANNEQAHIALSARNEKSLSRLKSELTGTQHVVAPLDVTKLDTIKKAHTTICNAWPKIDMVIFNAGIYTPMKAQKMDLEKALSTIDINLNGALNTISVALPGLLKQQSGSLVLIASVAGYSGLPRSLAYGASKAGLINLAESLRIELAPKNITVQLVCPGFVKTRLTEKNPFPMPCIIPVEKAATAIITGLKTSRFEIHFPKRFTYMLKLLSALPYWAYFALTKKLL